MPTQRARKGLFMKLKLLAGAALAAVFAASGAVAQPVADTGWYGAIDLGWHSPVSIEATGANLGVSNVAPTTFPFNWDFEPDSNWAGFARVGYKLSPHWRVELEGGYRPSDLESVTGPAGANAGVGPIAGLCGPGAAAVPPCTNGVQGNVDSFSLMGNVIFDFFPESTVSPFLGLGVGVNHVQVEANGRFVTIPAGGGANPQSLVIDDSDTVFAYQGDRKSVV